MCALDCLREKLPLGIRTSAAASPRSRWPARCPGAARGGPQVILDARAQTAGGAGWLAENLAGVGLRPETIAVCGMLARQGRRWRAPSRSRRASRAGISRSLEARAASATNSPQHVQAMCKCFSSPASAFEAALGRASENDKIVVFGSFLTVGEVMAWLKNKKQRRRNA